MPTPAEKPVEKKRRKNPGKGSAFERKVCQLMSLWVSNLTDRGIFWRSAMSGGRYTVQARQGRGSVSQAGDLSAVDPRGHALLATFIVECKHHKKLDLTSPIFDNAGNIREWWDKLTAQCTDLKRQPMLIAKGNFTRELVFLTRRGLELLDPDRDKLDVLLIYPQMGARVITLNQMIRRVKFTPSLATRLTGYTP